MHLYVDTTVDAVGSRHFLTLLLLLWTISKEKALNSVQDFLLGQDDDLCACLDRVGNLESTILAGGCGRRNTGMKTTVATASAFQRTQSGREKKGVVSLCKHHKAPGWYDVHHGTATATNFVVTVDRWLYLGLYWYS